MSRADFEDNLHIKLSLAQDTGKYLADSGVFLGPLFKGDTGDVALWRTDGTVGEGPKLPQGTATGGTLADTGTAQTLSGKSLSGSSIVDTGVHLAAYFAGGVGADTGTFLRGDGNWRQIQLARASDTGRYLADQGQFVIPSAATTAGIQAAIDSVSSGSAVQVKLLGTAYDLSGGSVTNNGRIVSWDIDPRATFTGAGTLPAISSPNYGGHTLKDGVQIYLTKGTEATPVSTGGSPLVTAAYGDTAAVVVAGHSTFAYKMSSASGARVRALYSEAVDPTGGTGTFIEGARLMGVLTGGTLGSAYGVIGFAGQSTTTQYDYMVAFEADLKDDFADAPDPASFSSSSFSAGMVFSNSGSKKVDAMLVANPFTSVKYRTGFMVAGAIDHSIIWNKAALVHGVALLEGSFSGSAFAMRDTDRLGIYSDTGVTLVSSYGHGQIKFPATQNASADANTLDDYEEGTFTPVLFGGTVAGTQTYSVQLGVYTKIGNVVYIDVCITLSALDGTTSGDMNISGLPFTSRNTTGLNNSLAVGLFTSINLDVAGGFYSMSAVVTPNSTNISLGQHGDNVVRKSVTHADFGNTSRINISGFYFV